MSHTLVIVESPAKGKKINGYLGSDYTVLASFGHIRDLPSKNGSVEPDNDFAMKWELSDRAGKTLSDIKKAMKNADTIVLATDPDREGEAISWHLLEYFNEKNLIKGKKITRVTFNEITKKAVTDAFANAREIDQDLVDAYLARRALDYLVGFNLSPVLWRKLPGSRSAGRVQSVALRIICEREDEIEKFKSDEYWTIGAVMHTPDGAPFEARLTHLSGNKLGKLDINSEDAAKAAVKRIESKSMVIQKIERKQSRRNPYAPFITSTLQQEASRKIGFGAQQTMRTAQKLYENGLITYMRTDGITLSGEAIAQTRAQIEKDFGKDYLPDSPRAYKSKAKNAQEAHEAIRPTSMSKTPQSMKLDPDQLKLYTLIWKRTMACQMESAVLDQVAVDISDGTDDVVLRANGSVIKFDGFLKLYRETDDDGKSDTDDNRILPKMEERDALKTHQVDPEQHFTQPPPRYTEASLVKKLEEEGIGRPSTYASIIQVLQDRNYVRIEQKRFIPEDRGRIVTTFLVKFFNRYVDYKFTAELEEELDAISAGSIEYKEALRLFWKNFSKTVEEIKPLTITQVIDELNDALEDHFFPKTAENPEPRKCKSCADGEISLKLGKFGAFIGCTNYPECKFTRRLEIQDAESDGGLNLDAEPHELGIHPDTQKPIMMKKGPYGVYVEMDEEIEDKKPKRQSLPAGVTAGDMTLEKAIDLLRLPRDVGAHPENGKMIEAAIGRFGPYLKYDGNFISLKKDDDVLTVGMNRAMQLIAEADAKKEAEKIREIGEHPKKGEMITLGKNRFGYYVVMGNKKSKLPKSTNPDDVTVDMAVDAMAPKKKVAAKKKKTTAKKKPAAKKK